MYLFDIVWRSTKMVKRLEQFSVRVVLSGFLLLFLCGYPKKKHWKLLASFHFFENHNRLFCSFSISLIMPFFASLPFRSFSPSCAHFQTLFQSRFLSHPFAISPDAPLSILQPMCVYQNCALRLWFQIQNDLPLNAHCTHPLLIVWLFRLPGEDVQQISDRSTEWSPERFPILQQSFL